MDFIKVSAKTVENAITGALIKLQTTSDKIEYEVLEKGSSGFLGFNAKPAVIKVRKKFTLQDCVKEFLQNIFKTMNLTVEIELLYNEADGHMDIELKGNDMGVLIGKRGQTLDALQYLISLVANRQSENYIRVKLDTENYRKRRRDTLENLARNIAFKVKRTKRPISLEPMNPYERRVIHSALQGDRYVVTHSEGDEPYRRIVVSLKNK